MNTFDLIMLSITLVLAIVGFVRGAIKTVLSVLGAIVSYVLSYTLGNRLAQPVYNSLFKDYVNEEISTRVSQLLENDTANIGDSIMDTLPDIFRYFVSDSDLISSLNNVVGDTTEQVVESATQIINQVAEPIFVGLVSICIMAILFIIFNIAVNLVLSLSDFINEIPIVGKANRIVGAVIGFLSGLVLIFITVFAYNHFIPFVVDNSDFNNDIRETSLFFEIFTDDESTIDIEDEFFAIEQDAEGEYGY